VRSKIALKFIFYSSLFVYSWPGFFVFLVEIKI